jgi:exosortase/archaeosortase family protein
MNADYSFLIADSCSGVNFLIAAFLMTALMLIWDRGNERQSWTSLPFSLAVAYITTIAANTVRISLAIKLHRMEAPSVWVNPEQLHRFQGIFIYFGFLVLLFVLIDRVQRQDSRKSLLRYLIPLSIYWLITLGVPLINDAYNRGIDLREHFLFVAVTPLVILMPLLMIEAVRRCRRRSML